jgi:hypothetical protein
VHGHGALARPEPVAAQTGAIGARGGAEAPAVALELAAVDALWLDVVEVDARRV